MKKFCLLLLMIAPLVAQDDRVRKTGDEEYLIDLQGNVVTREKIAVPDFKLEGEGLREAWQTINKVLRDDLSNSGFFEVLSKERIALIRSPHEGPIVFENWGSIEAQHLVVGTVRQQGGELRVEVRLYEIASRQSIIAKAFTGKPDLARKIAHKVADLILTHLRNSQFASSKIVFSARRKSQNDPKLNIDELFIMDYDGYNPLPITRGGIALSPSASKIGRNTFLVYAVFENPYTINATYGIYLKPTLLSRPTPLFQDKSRRTTSPSLSPDGKKIAFTIVERGNTDIWVMNLDGTDLLRLTSHPGVDTNPSWAPGGRSLLFTSDRTGTPQIYRMDADGLNTVRMTRENPYNDSAVWNPRHDYMAYVSRFENNFDIFIMDLQTRTNYRVTRQQGSNEDPHWSPDGEQLCFTSNRNGTWQIYAINKNGTNLRQITHSGNNREPVWIP